MNQEYHVKMVEKNMYWITASILAVIVATSGGLYQYEYYEITGIRDLCSDHQIWVQQNDSALYYCASEDSYRYCEHLTTSKRSCYVMKLIGNFSEVKMDKNAGMDPLSYSKITEEFEGGKYISGKRTFSGKEIRIPFEGKEYYLKDAVEIKAKDDRFFLKTIDGLECDYLWDKPTKIDIRKDLIDFKQGNLIDVRCNQEYTQEGDKLYFDSGWIIDIDPSITYTSLSDWNGSFYDTSTTADGENITLTKELRDDNFNEEAQVSTGINMTGNVLLLHMNDGVGNGGTVVDTSGEGNDGTATFDGSGTCSGINGKFDTACNFDGTTDRITISDDNSLDLNNNFTMSAWVKFSDTTGSQRVISKHDGTTNRYFMRLDNGNKMLCAYAGTEYTYCDVSYSADTWYHLACVLDEDNMAYAYIDGNLQCNKTVTPEAVGAGDVTISSYSGAGEFFNGVVDEVAIWNRSFSQTEITNSYNRGALTHGSYTSLVENAGYEANWTNITWSSTEPSATINISVQVRSCDDPACSGESWSSFYYGEGVHHNLTQPANQYFQYNVSFDSNDASNISLSLEDLTLAWRATDFAPVITNKTFNPVPAYTNNTLNATWRCYDAEDSTLSFNNTWYNNSVFYSENVSNYANNSIESYFLLSSITSKWENWSAQACCSDSVQTTCEYVGSVNISNSAPYFSPALVQQNPQAGKETNYSITCLDADNDIITYADNTTGTSLSYYSILGSITGIFQFRPSYYEFLFGQINISVNCTDGWETANSSFIMNTTECVGAAEECDLGCVIISDGCSANIVDNCTLISS